MFLSARILLLARSSYYMGIFRESLEIECLATQRRGWRNIINLVSSINLAEYQFVINIQHPASKREEGTERARQVDKVSLGRLVKEMILSPAGVAKLMRKHFTRTKCFDLE